MTAWLRCGLLTCLAVSLVACATRTQVTLLPESDGKPSAVIVRNQGDQARLEQPYAVSKATKSGSIAVSSTTAEMVAEKYGQILRITPPPAAKFRLEFLSGGATLTDESGSALASVLNAAQSRAAGEILITGHTDTTGTPELNDQLSKERAESIRTLFIDAGFPPDRIYAVGRGHRELLIPTAPGVDEPRNRRVEITVR